MTYNVEKYIENYGKERILEKIFVEGITLVQLHKELGLSNSSGRMHKAVYERIYKYLNISSLPYKEDRQELRKFKLAFDRVGGRYWESEYICEYLFSRLETPTLNKSDKSIRYVINFPKHPKSDPISNQIKAHIVLWELVNEQYVPEDCWVVPLDGSYINLDISNWVLVNITVHKHNKFSGINNPSYIHGLALRPKQGGWSKISKTHISKNPSCVRCGKCETLVVHHIINYHLFGTSYNSAHSDINLMTLCTSCHSTIHQNNINIKALIEETRYSKLLELLETLKSQVPDTLIEIYRDVEKQLGLTDNQQPSTA